MHSQNKYWLTLLLALAVLCMVGVSRADAQALPPLQFATPDPINLTWAELEDGVAFELLNNTTEASLEVIVTLQLVNSKREPLSQEAIKLVLPGQSQQGSSAKLLLSPAGSAVISLQAGTQPPQDSYTGYLVAYAGTPAPSQDIARKNITLTIKPQSNPVLLPIAKEWSSTLYRTRPWFSSVPWQPRTYTITLPLQPGITPSQQQERQWLGTVQKPGQGAAIVWWTGNIVDLGRGTAGLVVELEGLEQAGPGIYSGDLDLNGAGEDGTVKLNATFTDQMCFPLLAIIGGLVLAIRVRRLSGVSLTISDLNKREARIAKALMVAEEGFVAAAKNPPYAAYTLQPNAAQLQAKVRANIRTLETSYFLTLNEQDPRYQAILQDLQTLEDAAANWANFSGKRNELDQALRTLENALPSANMPPGLPSVPGSSRSPRFINAARKLLAGGPLAVADFAQRRADVEQASKLVSIWHTLNELASAYNKWARKLETYRPQMTEEDQKRLTEAQAAISEGWIDLWSASDIQTLTQHAPTERLAVAEQYLAQLSHYLAEPPQNQQQYESSSGRAQDDMNAQLQLLSLNALWKSLLSPPTDPAARATFYLNQQRGLGLTLVLIALFVTVWTGLQALYIGHTFGSLFDYVNAFLWGLVTPVALAVLTDTLQHVWQFWSASR